MSVAMRGPLVRRRWYAIALAAVACSPSANAPRRPGPSVWSYEVTVGADSALDVEGHLGSDANDRLFIDEDMERYVAIATRAPTVRYHVRLGDAARELHDVDTAWASGEAIFAPPSSWLLRPTDSPPGTKLRVHVTTAPGADFATALHAAPSGAASTWEVDADAVLDSGFAAFGALRRAKVPNRPIEIVLARGVSLSDATVVRWIDAEARADEGYSLRPWPATLFVAPGDSDVMRGKTLGDGGASVLLRIGTSVNEGNLRDDWVCAHELVHVSFPALDRDHAWFSEGLATYVEPIARVRAGLSTPEKLWGDLVDGLPRGLAARDAGGLDGTHDIDRVYWGGALYFLLADMRIRERTRGRRSLEDAVAAIGRAAASPDRAAVEVSWAIERVVAVGDGATGTSVLADLYRAMARSPFRFDLATLFARLGVRKADGMVTFDDGAPDAAVRHAIEGKVAQAGGGR